VVEPAAGVESSVVSCFAFAVKRGAVTDMVEAVEIVLVPVVVEEHHIYQALATLRRLWMVILPRSSDQTASVEAVEEQLLWSVVSWRMAIVQWAVEDEAAVAAGLKWCFEAEAAIAAWT